jgi:hypothetical protein
MQKQINPVPTKLLIPILSSRRMFRTKTLVWPEYFERGWVDTLSPWRAMTLNIDDNKMKIYDSLINIEYIYYAGLKEIMINVLKELRSMKKSSYDHPDCELIDEITSCINNFTIVYFSRENPKFRRTRCVRITIHPVYLDLKNKHDK